jgi:crossover junction endodeoxyribonuclease RusA
MLYFPWPNSRLSPNRRIDRRALIADKHQAREIGYLITKDAGLSFPAVELEMKLTLCPPDNRKRDDDNIYSAFKSYRDGMFQALGLDDRLIRRAIIEWGGVCDRGVVIVELSIIPEWEKTKC